MRRSLIALAVSILALGTVPARAQPAASPVTINCPAKGFTFVLPDPGNWTYPQHACRDGVTAIRSGDNALFTVISERHGWWSDERSRSSITYDLGIYAASGLPSTGMQYGSATIDGHRFYMGAITCMGLDGATRALTEYETFFTGHMYKVRATVRLSAWVPDAADQATVRLLDRMAHSVRLYPRQ